MNPMVPFLVNHFLSKAPGQDMLSQHKSKFPDMVSNTKMILDHHDQTMKKLGISNSDLNLS